MKKIKKYSLLIIFILGVLLINLLNALALKNDIEKGLVKKQVSQVVIK